ncbi:MAG: alpha/beta hydrolase [Alphaproteobacteria bacterium PA2]|nr:MAG: alpha/beta hydrolase [Alphaproteobacteria bacterium PA2]
MPMPSEELQAFNQHARDALKAAFNADYDPIAMRAAREAAPVLELQSTLLPVGEGQVEMRPGAACQRLVVYVAGGGFCFDANDTHRQLIDELASATGSDACLVRYRLAPEHPFPAAYEDVGSAMDHLIAARGAENLAVIADSAGAALVLSVVMARLATGEAPPCRLAFLSALTDLAMTGPSHVANAEADPLFGPQAIIHKAMHYLQGHNPTDPAASPFWGDPSGLPPMLFIVGSTEVMRDDSVRFVDKARASGVDARVSIYEEAPHTFPLLARFPETIAAIGEVGDFLRQAWP